MESLSTMIEDIDFIDKYSVVFKYCVHNNIYTLKELLDADVVVKRSLTGIKIEGVRNLLRYKCFEEKNKDFDDVLFLNFYKMSRRSRESVYYNDNFRLCLKLGLTNEESDAIVCHAFDNPDLNIGEIILDILREPRRILYIGERKTNIFYRKLNLLAKYYKELNKTPDGDVVKLELK